MINVFLKPGTKRKFNINLIGTELKELNQDVESLRGAYRLRFSIFFPTVLITCKFQQNLFDFYLGDEVWMNFKKSKHSSIIQKEKVLPKYLYTFSGTFLDQSST
ncbi:hypothetical protein BpHYR1_053888 [Brachionus plicatilis]|uniref:Uncharacterized protein n=1 Tax=Brachionus plicatilis TaxID=10195 RepID=A0A3M7T1E9_BRAPC|nr:hypothetical protein BpHYR1_053888 [Brachionus plicatilis]